MVTTLIPVMSFPKMRGRFFSGPPFYRNCTLMLCEGKLIGGMTLVLEAGSFSCILGCHLLGRRFREIAIVDQTLKDFWCRPDQTVGYQSIISWLSIGRVRVSQKFVRCAYKISKW